MYNPLLIVLTSIIALVRNELEAPKIAIPVAPFFLSLLAALLILGGSGMMMTFSSGVPVYGGMMGGYYGMMGGFYGMMQGFGYGGMGWFYALAAIGLVSGVVILIGAIMIYTEPSRASAWGVLILLFSIVSFFGMGGFFLGAILGVLGGILALAYGNSRESRHGASQALGTS
jgi:hypothetical protein